MRNLAIEIIEKMGGKRTLTMMLNAKDFKFHATQKYVSFRFTPRNELRANTLKISALDDGMFKVEFIRVYGNINKCVKLIENVLINDIQKVFELNTKLNLSY